MNIGSRRLLSIIMTMIFALSLTVPTYAGNKRTDISELVINTNNKGVVSITPGWYEEGQVIVGYVIPNQGYSLEQINSNHTIVERIGNLSFTFVMPAKKTNLTFVFEEIEFRNETNYGITDADEPYIRPMASMRGFTDAEIINSEMYAGMRYISGEILLYASAETHYSYIEDLATSYGGEIAGYLEMANVYQLYFGNGLTESELRNLVDLFDSDSYINLATLNRFNEVALETEVPATDLQDAYIRPDDAEWRGLWTDYDLGDFGQENWGVERIDAPKAWLYSEQMDDIGVGIIDNNFLAHSDIDNITILNPGSDADTNDHGTHVAGIIGASHNNDGIAGVSPNSNLSFERAQGTTMGDQLNLANLLDSGVNVINASLGTYGQTDFPTYADHTIDFANTDERIVEMVAHRDEMTVFLNAYLERGVDFVLINSAGNQSTADRKIHTGYKGYWANIADPNLAGRIIVVANLQEDGNLRMSSNVGERVDIAAPGTNILSCVGGNGYDTQSGTSMAAPHVAGVVSMVWGINPDLTGSQVKEIIVNNTIDDVTVTVAPAETVVENGQIVVVTPEVSQTYPILNANEAVMVARNTPGESQNLVSCEGIVRPDSSNTGIMPQTAYEVYNVMTGELVLTGRTDDNGRYSESLIQTGDSTDGANTYVFRFLGDGFRTGIAYYRLTDSAIPFKTVFMQSGRDLTIMIDGTELVSAPVPFLYPSPILTADRTLVPVRPIAQALGFDVGWTDSSRTVTLTRNDITITMIIGRDTFTVTDNANNTSEEMNFIDGVQPEIASEWTYLPLRTLCEEALGLPVLNWDQANLTAWVTTQ
jgi:hypothetical protein